MNIESVSRHVFCRVAFVCLVFIISGWTATPLPGQTADEIIREVDERNKVDTCQMSLVMSVYPDRRNERNVRQFSLTSLERGSEDSTMTFTETPQPERPEPALTG